jgi:hypothetical protein
VAEEVDGVGKKKSGIPRHLMSRLLEALLSLETLIYFVQLGVRESGWIHFTFYIIGTTSFIYCAQINLGVFY